MKVNPRLLKQLADEKKLDPKELIKQIDDCLDLIFDACKKKISPKFDFKAISKSVNFCFLFFQIKRNNFICFLFFQKKVIA